MTARALALALLLASCASPAGRPTLLDGFEDLRPWRAAASDGVRARIEPGAGDRGDAGSALRLAIDFAGTAGYAVARRELPLELPGNFEISFDLRGALPANHLELKFVDASGENVWWYRRADFDFPAAWRHVIVKRSQIKFAWGPTADRTLRRVAAIELTIACGRGGGSGWVEVDRLAIRALPETSSPAAPVASATSELPGAAAALAIDGQPGTAWRSDPRSGPAQTFTLDLGGERDLSGLIVRWAGAGYAADYTVERSVDGQRWKLAGVVRGGDGGLDPFVVPGVPARYLRLRLERGPAPGYALGELQVVDAEEPPTINTLVAALARQASRGRFPRGWVGEQPYWTIVGVDGVSRTGLLSEDGALEVRPGGFTIEPFVQTGQAVTTWADAEVSQSLADGYLPVPSVTWRAPGFDLTVTAVGAGAPGRAGLVGRYRLRNRGDRTLEARLVLAVRPLQVNPPTQFLGVAGGASPIRELAWDGAKLVVDAAVPVFPLPAPGRVSLYPLHAVGFPETALAPTPTSLVDDSGLASAALGYDLSIAPGGEATVAVVVPLDGPPDALNLPPAERLGPWLEKTVAAARGAWHEKLDRVAIRVPPAGEPVVATLRSSLAYMLLSRDGPSLRPGTRSYARSWIRDGAMIGEALLRLGHPGVAADYLRWFAPYQFASGKVPCCVDARGADPVAENDSHGELIHLAVEVYRYTRDRELLAAMWPHVERAAHYLEALRQSERTSANQTPARRAFYGLLPRSISHEGYSARPAYSYWDQFWGLRGFADAAFAAGVLGEREAEARLAGERDAFRADLLASIEASVAAHAIDYVPGAADLGDFDATSTTIALSPGGVSRDLPQALLAATFERYWQSFVARRDGREPWSDYTPYELRVVGAFVRLGWRVRAARALERFLGDRRPAAWNQWAEVVGRQPREPRFIGDMPHAWVHSDFTRSALDLFAYEREAEQSMVLAAGVPASWLAGEGVATQNLRTPYGPLGYSLRATDAEVILAIDAGPVPPGGLVFPWPYEGEPGAARVNGHASPWSGGELVVHERPARVTVSRRPSAVNRKVPR